MRALRVCFLLLLAIPAALSQKKEQWAEMQRDIAQIQTDLKTLQNSQSATLGQIQGMLTQLTSAIDNTNTKVQNQLQDGLRQQQQAISAPVANLNNRMDQMAQSFQELKETILDMNGRIGKLDAKIQDLQNQIQLGGHPAPPPGAATPGPGDAGGGTVGNTGPSGLAACPPTMQADNTYSNARRDYMAGQYDLAMQEFGDYSRCFPGTTYAPNAQYYLGDILYKKGNYEDALVAFDKVIEQFPDNNKTGDAHFMKGNTLVKLGRKDAAVKEYRKVVSNYPDTDSAIQARAKLRELGLATAPSKRK